MQYTHTKCIMNIAMYMSLLVLVIVLMLTISIHGIKHFQLEYILVGTANFFVLLQFIVLCFQTSLTALARGLSEKRIVFRGANSRHTLCDQGV